METSALALIREWLVERVRRFWTASAERRGILVSALKAMFSKKFWWQAPKAIWEGIRQGLLGFATLIQAAVNLILNSRSARRFLTGSAIFIGFGWLSLAFLAWLPERQVAEDLPSHEIYYLDQGWGQSVTSADRQTYYYTPQGTSMDESDFRYSWLVNLEQNHFFGTEKFMAPGHMRALGFQVDNIPTPENPDRLPVGFARRFSPTLADDILDITCAACHTGELHVEVKGNPAGIRIDGGQGMHAFTSTAPGQFGTSLTSAVATTLLHPLKFRRFAKGVLGKRYSVWNSVQLYGEVSSVLVSLLHQATDDAVHNRYPVDEGFGRTDAIGRIANTAFGKELDPVNYAQGNAPVSYPAIWDAHYWDWVQYGASVSQPMGRNLGESLGTGATLHLKDSYGGALKPEDRFVVSTLVRNLKKIEDTVAKLEAPTWPENLLGAIDQEKAAKGKVLFETHCAGCHEPCLEPESVVQAKRPLLLEQKKPFWRVNALPVSVMGTDPQAAMNFVNRRIDLRRTGLTREDVIGKIRPILEEQWDRKSAAYRKDAKFNRDPGDKEMFVQAGLDAISITGTTIGQALNYVDLFVRDKYYEELGIEKGAESAEYDGEGALDVPRVKMIYKARPLSGVWATAPYLHNGSVPTLYDLLSPVNERPRKFFIRSRSDFDPVRVGLVASPMSQKGFWLDTTIQGNRNTGHEFRAGAAGKGQEAKNGVLGPEFTPAERFELIEYLKIYKETGKACGPLENGDWK